MRKLVHLGKNNRQKSFLTTVEARLGLLGEEIAEHRAGNSLAQEVSAYLEGIFLFSLMWTVSVTTQTTQHAQWPDCYPKAHLLLSHPTRLPVSRSGLRDSLSRVGRKGTLGEEKCWRALLILKLGSDLVAVVAHLWIKALFGSLMELCFFCSRRWC